MAEYTGLRAITTVTAPAKAPRPMRTKSASSTIFRPAVDFLLAGLGGPVGRSGSALPHLDSLIRGEPCGRRGAHPPIGGVELGEVDQRVVGEHVGNRTLTIHE